MLDDSDEKWTTIVMNAGVRKVTAVACFSSAVAGREWAKLVSSKDSIWAPPKYQSGLMTSNSWRLMSVRQNNSDSKKQTEAHKDLIQAYIELNWIESNLIIIGSTALRGPWSSSEHSASWSIRLLLLHISWQEYFPGWGCQPHAQPPAILDCRCFLSGPSPLADLSQF
jgi:hypothetical protein